MNSPISPRSLVAAAVAAVLLVACTAAPTRPEGAAGLRSRLSQLQSNPELAGRAPLALQEAELAVVAAETPQADQQVSTHLVFLADRRISIAEAQAQSRLAVDQRVALGEQREAMRLQARTQEADAANRRALAAQATVADQKQEIDAARNATADAQRDAAELQQQIAEMEAKETERGIVLTLGDVLFSSGTADLNPMVNSNLGKLAAFLVRYPDRTVMIEGYTDSIGTDEYNQGLSQRRADAVKSYLMRQDIAAARLTAFGKGESTPVGDNTSATGRQQNRRVEVIIADNRVSAR